MVKVRFKTEDTRADQDGIGYISWHEYQQMVSDNAEAVELLQGNEEVGTAEDMGEVKGDAGGPASADDFDSMSRAELDAEAERRGVDIAEARNKSDVVATLRAAVAGDEGGRGT